MTQFLGLLLLSFFVTSILIFPFIDLLYKLKFKRRYQETLDAFEQKTPIFDSFHNSKKGTPVGAGLLIIPVTTSLALWATIVLELALRPLEMFVIAFTFISFGILGFYDDLKKFFPGKENFFGLRMRHKLIIQIILSTIIGLVLYFGLGYDFVFIHWFGQIYIGPLFVPLTVFVITAFANAFNITDGLDGLSTGLLVICLGAFAVISQTIIDSTMAMFIYVWIGSLIAFLYFNVNPARILLGDVGALSFGATLGVLGLLTGKLLAISVIGFIFFLEAGSSFLQLFWKRYFHCKIFAVAPLHLYLQKIGWEEPKIVMRAWLGGLLLAIIGLWLAFMS